MDKPWDGTGFRALTGKGRYWIRFTRKKTPSSSCMR